MKSYQQKSFNTVEVAGGDMYQLGYCFFYNLSTLDSVLKPGPIRSYSKVKCVWCEKTDHFPIAANGRKLNIIWYFFLLEAEIKDCPVLLNNWISFTVSERHGDWCLSGLIKKLICEMFLVESQKLGLAIFKPNPFFQFALSQARYIFFS